jgi:wyosine [tRNA(Phe)-imidazoG37] synthetase (radical SAM superfamily)
MATTPNNVKGVTARTAETFRGPFKGRDFEKLSETAAQLAKELKKKNIEDRSTLVNNSNILREAIEQVLSFLESVRVLKVLVNYWNFTFALLGKEMIISRDPENQLLMKVVDSSVTHPFGELDFTLLSNAITQMFGDVTSGDINKDDTKFSLLADESRELETETKVSQAMINQLDTEK